MSWRGFRSNLRAILLLAIGCVLFTATAVAAVAHYALGLPWSIGFVLGAIVSPPDAVAPMAVLREIGLPRRLTTVLEGESLVNDATALVAFSFALGAVATNTFSLEAATVKFVVVVAGEIGFGIAVGWLMLRLRHLSNEPRAEVLLALSTPFIAFWPPHALGGSGVVACVAAGLYVSWNGRRLIRPATRLQGYFIWDLVTWVVEALLFLLTGLQARGRSNQPPAVPRHPEPGRHAGDDARTSEGARRPEGDERRRQRQQHFGSRVGGAIAKMQHGPRDGDTKADFTANDDDELHRGRGQ
jgi:CPA1 family monovalent cation:H+ antiporter